MATLTKSPRRAALVYAFILMAGIWLLLSPYLLGFAWEQNAWWNATLIGASLTLIALLRFANPTGLTGLRWTTLIVALWLMLSPFVADYYDIRAAFWSAFIVGALTLIVASSEAATRPLRAT
ncbi:hypothetical protein FRC91_16185 [Bradymonadales bacterium TMQ1]|uniref:SPW repeat-containing integral membrane domain-containing protein n=1 Tax=Lujinxingia sediminis TaxID=2480984 RepID=A0ABY0CQJ7_9DELT|nr:SPW repeat protein [Lujinxingia sediminis]RVU42450.1 hypothetical protein EA187_16365 [Lujinxingia sediminis]TXC74650.1 hypothetical protein FRC91_16185 [Bradymonadales bacterium TMQ1]